MDAAFRADFTALPARDRYKLLCALVVPRPIALVTTLGPGGIVNAAPFSFFNVFAETPPLVVLGLQSRPDGSLKDTSAHIRNIGSFTVNLVDEALAERMNVCAVDFPPGTSELDAAGLTALPAVSIPVPRQSDPDQVAPIMRDCALAHREVMSEPSARVLFKRITDTALEFDLVCFVDDVEVGARVSSDLMFACHRALRAAGIMPSPPAPSDEAAGEEPKSENSIEKPGQPPATASPSDADFDPKPIPSPEKADPQPASRKEPARQSARASRVKVTS